MRKIRKTKLCFRASFLTGVVVVRRRRHFFLPRIGRASPVFRAPHLFLPLRWLQRLSLRGACRRRALSRLAARHEGNPGSPPEQQQQHLGVAFAVTVPTLLLLAPSPFPPLLPNPLPCPSRPASTSARPTPPSPCSRTASRRSSRTRTRGSPRSRRPRGSLSTL